MVLPMTWKAPELKLIVFFCSVGLLCITNQQNLLVHLWSMELLKTIINSIGNHTHLSAILAVTSTIIPL